MEMNYGMRTLFPLFRSVLPRQETDRFLAEDFATLGDQVAKRFDNLLKSRTLTARSLAEAGQWRSRGML